jgi:hypothetical protein
MTGRRTERPIADGIERDEDDILARRLHELRWPAPPKGARERGWEKIQEVLRSEADADPDENGSGG